MIKKVIYFICFIAYTLGYSQINCENSIFYELSLEKPFINNKRYLVNFDFKFSDFSKKGLFTSTLLSEEEKPLVKHELSQSYFEIPCKKIIDKFKELENRPLDDKLRYTVINFFRPIYISEKKVYLFFEGLIMQKDVPRVFGGGLAMHTFKKEDGVWVLAEKKTLELY